MLWKSTRLLDRDEQPTGIIACGLDVTDYKRIQEDLLKRESLARLGELAAVVAHEVKNPLAGMGGALRVICGRMAPENPDREIIHEILARMGQLADSVNDLLLFARPSMPSLRELPLQLLLEGAISLLAEDPQFSDVAVEVSGPEVNVRCDPEMLKPVFLNVLANAAQAMEGAGKVSILVSTDDDCCWDGCCQVTVTDTGPGMPEDVREKVFEPFFTTKNRGTGLGLSIAKRVIELHGGEIALECPPEGGTRVSIQLPLAH